MEQKMSTKNARRVLITGLNGAGKSYIGRALAKELDAIIWDGDSVREGLGNNDFSVDSRIKQGKIMDYLSKECIKQGKNAICSFIAPLELTKSLFYDDSFIIFVDTIKPEDNKYEDTGRIYQNPTLYHYHVTSKTKDIDSLVRDIMIEYNYFCAESQKKVNYNI